MDPVIRSAAVSLDARRLPQSPAPKTMLGKPAAPAAPVLPVEPLPGASDAQQRLDALRKQMADEALAREQTAAASKAALDEQLADALADAEQRGLALGMDQAKASARALVADQVQVLDTLAAALRGARMRVLEEGEDLIVELAFGALCRMLGERAGDRQGVAALVRAQIAAVRDANGLVARVHPDDLDGLSGIDALPGGVALLPDAGVGIGGCMLDSAVGTLDARLDTQLSALRAALLAVRAARREEGQQI